MCHHILTFTPPYSLRHVSSLLFFIVAGGAAIYGVTYAYLLHYLINGVAAWLVILQLSKSTLTVTRLTQLLSGSEVIGDSSTTKKRP